MPGLSFSIAVKNGVLYINSGLIYSAAAFAFGLICVRAH